MIINLNQAIQELRAGNVVAFPTETVYGLGADATNDLAIKKIFTLKNRPLLHPLIVHIGNMQDLYFFVDNPPPLAITLAEHFWPGPLTLVLQKKKNVSNLITANQDTVALRMPAHPLALQLLKNYQPLVGPSANMFSKLSPTTAQHVADSFANRVPILDGGPCQVGIESTIVYVRDNFWQILRPGMITSDQIANLTDGQKMLSTSIRTAGMHKCHYQPKTPIFLCDNTPLVKKHLQHCARMCANIVLADYAQSLSHAYALPNDPMLYARSLYNFLYTIDQSKKLCVYLIHPPTTTAWQGIIDRLKKAASYIITNDNLEDLYAFLQQHNHFAASH